MSVQYHASKLTNMDTESSKTGYEKFFEDGSKLQYSVYALRNSPFRMATVCLGLLCFFLLAGVIGQAVHYQKVGQDHQTNFEALSKEKENLQEDLRTTQKGKRDFEASCNQLRQNFDFLSRKNNQVQTNNNLLTREKTRLLESQSQLQEKNTALEKEKEELKARQDLLKTTNNALSKAKELLQGHFDSMTHRKNELQTNYDSVTNDRNNLQNKFNNMSRLKDQLQIQYNALIKDVEDLEQRYNHSLSEKDKIESSHQNVTTAKDTLQATYNLLKKTTDELRASHIAVVKEKLELSIRLQNATQERDLLKAQNNNLTAERDQLQVELERLNVTMEARTCPAGWQKFEFSCYFTSDTKKTWIQSREDCQARGADLAIITSKKEMAFINSLYGSDKEVWIGLTDEGVEGQWKWIDGTALTLAFWGSGQPNSHNGRDQDCVEFWHRASGTGEWNDESCTIKQNWICEK